MGQVGGDGVGGVHVGDGMAISMLLGGGGKKAEEGEGRREASGGGWRGASGVALVVQSVMAWE